VGFPEFGQQLESKVAALIKELPSAKPRPDVALHHLTHTCALVHQWGLWLWKMPMQVQSQRACLQRGCF
jgi:hypothetical protein